MYMDKMVVLLDSARKCVSDFLLNKTEKKDLVFGKTRSMDEIGIMLEKILSSLDVGGDANCL